MAFTFAGRWGPEIFMDEDQNLFRNSYVSVYNKGTSVLATLYTDRTKATTAANPFSTDTFGNGSFFADPGEYDIDHSGFRFTITVPMDYIEAQGDGPPTGPAGGVLGGNYPDPTLSAAKQAELDAKATTAAMTAALALKADLASPALSGNPTAPTQAPGNNSTRLANTAFVKAAVDVAVAALIGGSPAALDALNELAAALGNDPNFATTIANSIATKLAIAGHTANSVPVSIAGSLADLSMGASTILARLASGNVIAATPAQLRTLLGILATTENTYGPVAVPGSGTGTVNIDHNLNSTGIKDVTVTKVSTGEVWGIKVTVSTVNRVILDFDTYARAANEFNVVVGI